MTMFAAKDRACSVPQRSLPRGLGRAGPINTATHGSTSGSKRRTHQIRRLPVVNEKHEVVGMLSLSDLVRKAAIEASVIAATLQSICEPAHAAEQRTERIITAA